MLEKRGLIEKKLFKQEEVVQIVADFKSYLINSGALDSTKVSDWEFQNYLKTKKLVPGEMENSKEIKKSEETKAEESIEDIQID